MTERGSPARQHWGGLVWVGLLIFLAAVVAVLSVSYLYAPVSEMRFEQQRASFAEQVWAIRLHAAGGLVALLFGSLQFLHVIRLNWPGIHRWIGRVYLVGVLAGAIGAVSLAPNAWGGLPSASGFMLLGVFWASCASIAFWRIRAGDVPGHRAWMIRTYAITFAAVTLRLELLFLGGIGFDQLEAYMTVAWLSWVPNLIVAELWLARHKLR